MTSIPLLVETIECTQFRCIYLKNKRIFSEYSYAFFESALSLEHFQKKMTLIAYVFPKLQNTKKVLRQMSKSSCFRGPLDRRHGKRAEALIQY